MKYQRGYSNGQKSVYNNFWRLAAQMLVLGLTFQASGATKISGTNKISLEKSSNTSILLSSNKQNNLTVINENSFDVTTIANVEQYRSDTDIVLEQSSNLPSLKRVARSTFPQNWIGKRCTIKNRKWNEYLYAAGDYFNYDSYRRRVFTWIPEDVVSQGYWIIDHYGSNFAIYNIAHAEYLYAASDGFKFSNNRRSVFTYTTSESVRQGEWEITPVNYGEYFTIKNVVHGEYLFADGNYQYDSDRRRVFTWRYSGPPSAADSHWQISC